MLIFIASTGRSLDVAVGPETRISAIMETLLGCTGIPAHEQILMCEGSRLDAAKCLSNYSLPGSPQTRTRDVFLYNKSHMRIHGTQPAEETLKDLEKSSSDEHESEERPEFSGSPTHRVLLQYDHDFRAHLKDACHKVRIAKLCHQHCLELISEMEVQSKAIDSARSSVETHYNYIHSQLSAFDDRFGQQRRAHHVVLTGFEEELSAMAAVPLHPAICSGHCSSLIDLIDAPKLRLVAAECQAFHHNLNQKVVALDGLFESLKAEVEAVFMEAPSVNLEALALQAEAMQRSLDEMESMVQVLDNDCDRMDRILAQAGGSPSLDGRAEQPTALDSCILLETVQENHTAHLLPSMAEFHDQLQGFYRQCVADKNQMIKDVVNQLRRISSQQTHIQGMRNRMGAFREAALKEAQMMKQLYTARQTSAAYRQCLAECMRRQAFAEVYVGQAEHMAERLGKLRDKEQSKRDDFRHRVASIIPASLLSKLGLQHAPQHCQVSLAPAPSDLAPVSLSDLQAASLSIDYPASARMAPASPAAASDAQGDQDGPGSPTGTDRISGLELLNAQLREEVAQLHARVAQAEGVQTAYAQHGRASMTDQATVSDKWQAALLAKQGAMVRLEQDLAASKMQASVYTDRISRLETDLAQQSLS